MHAGAHEHTASVLQLALYLLIQCQPFMYIQMVWVYIQARYVHQMKDALE